MGSYITYCFASTVCTHCLGIIIILFYVLEGKKIEGEKKSEIILSYTRWEVKFGCQK